MNADSLLLLPQSQVVGPHLCAAFFCGDSFWECLLSDYQINTLTRYSSIGEFHEGSFRGFVVGEFGSVVC